MAKAQQALATLMLLCGVGAAAGGTAQVQLASSGAEFLGGTSSGSRELASLLFTDLRRAEERNLTAVGLAAAGAGFKDLTKSELEFTSDEALPKPQFSAETMPAVSPTLRCIINLCAQYFLIYSFLAISVTLNQMKPSAFFATMEHIFRASSATVTYAPMLSVMFLGTRMRAIQLTQGETEKYGLPQWWVQACMNVCTYSLLGQVLLLIFMSTMVGEAVKVSSTGDLEVGHMSLPKWPGLIMNVLRYVLVAFLYVGLFVILAGVTMMKGPVEIWGREAPPVSPAVQCTMTLSLTFFGIYLGLAFSKTALEANPGHALFTKMEAVFTDARFTVNLAPMCAVLFIGARMRALQIDPMWGNPPIWAQGSFFLCTFAILFQAFFSVFGPLVCECKVEKGECDGDVTFIFKRRTWTGFFAILRYVSLGAIYVGVVVVMASVFLMQHPEGREMTPPVSPAMQCVMFLTVQYFLVFTGLMVCITLNQVLENNAFVQRLIRIFRSGQETVMFVPMLAVLFIGCRMRALQLTRADDGTIPPSAGPQPWAQKAMFVATLSVALQMAMAMIVNMIMDAHHDAIDHVSLGSDTGSHRDVCANVEHHADAVKSDLLTPRDGEKGEDAVTRTQQMVAIALECLHYVFLLAMYASVITIIIAICVMTPETLPPYVYAK